MLAAANLLPRPIVDFRPSSDRIQRTGSVIGFYLSSVGGTSIGRCNSDSGRRPSRS
jgi:hypothetical protein